MRSLTRIKVRAIAFNKLCSDRATVTEVMTHNCYPKLVKSHRLRLLACTPISVAKRMFEKSEKV
ncbi:hypothetical protein H6G97_27320 [Nostoc flagelliforme FACHB-838]|uniref:Uncharacterized protein n=1 Tax=Nostoc flagelliforme FACHB-838 TaxID=2692904 RepID=A0ABR8DUJ7_9NOSO|nr:hypothetical protein [Nostoc flagelliforme]MBD2533079.1 hypothetical protein [Nostoc flagelliforme FACHB-838]